MQPDQSGPIPRPTARVLLLDEEDSLFLIHTDGEFHGSPPAVWLPPGGGLEAGETHEAAALRELRGECGLVQPILGPVAWQRRYVGSFRGRLYEKLEQYFVYRVPHFEIGPDLYDNIDSEGVIAYRWWSLDEITSSDELFVPRDLAGLLPAILRGEHPQPPVDTGA